VVAEYAGRSLHHKCSQAARRRRYSNRLVTPMVLSEQYSENWQEDPHHFCLEKIDRVEANQTSSPEGTLGGRFGHCCSHALVRLRAHRSQVVVNGCPTRAAVCVNLCNSMRGATSGRCCRGQATMGGAASSAAKFTRILEPALAAAVTDRLRTRRRHPAGKAHERSSSPSSVCCSATESTGSSIR
jgi:hypothetical protein